MLYRAHEELAAWYEQSGRGSEREYWKLPGVWPGVKGCFDAFFKENPGWVGWHHNYALAAYKAEDWETLRKELKVLGPINYRYFGGEAAFRKVVQQAEEKAAL